MAQPFDQEPAAEFDADPSGLEEADRLAVLPPDDRASVVAALAGSIVIELATHADENPFRRWFTTIRLRRALTHHLPELVRLSEAADEADILDKVAVVEHKRKRLAGLDRAKMRSAQQQP